MNLIVVHFHLRPGGIRRIIEQAIPHLVREFKAVRTVTLATGEAPSATWESHFRAQITGIKINLLIEPAFHYLAEQRARPAQITTQLRTAFKKILSAADSQNTLVWAHNPGIARNLLLAQELARACQQTKAPLIFHHHDWWFDNRWQRWQEIRQSGFSTLNQTAKTILPTARNIHHLAINQTDTTFLQRHFHQQAGWLPNLTERVATSSAVKQRQARQWLKSHTRIGHAPVWIVPSRLLRRKNIAEALLLTRWLRPEAWLITTGAASSADEIHYAQKLATAAQAHQWPLELSVLQGGEQKKPGVSDLLAVSEAVLLTSIQEGFGLPYLEAATAQRPLIARAIPNISLDLNEFGFRFPQYYEEILIHPGLFNWQAEVKRQRKLFRHWLAQLPLKCQSWVERPTLLLQNHPPGPAPFSRLTLSASSVAVRMRLQAK